MKHRSFCLLLAFSFLAQAPGAQESASPIARFQPGNNPGEFVFDTGVLQGKLRAGGRSLGLSPVIHIPTGARLDQSMGLFSHYRLFSRGNRYGTGVWDLPSSATLRNDGSVETTVPAAENRPFSLRAIYRWQDRTTLDLETIVQAESDLPAWEVFLASYFSPSFTNSLVLAMLDSKPGLIEAEKAAGTWQIFPREPAAALIIQDGRWALPPHPVEWTVRSPLAGAVAIRRAPRLQLDVVLMGTPETCFAIATPHQAETHYSTYLSLFGCDVKAGHTARSRCRLAFCAALEESEVRRMYARFLSDLSQRDGAGSN